MKKLLEIQNQYIAEMKKVTARTVELLGAARNSLANHVGHCNVLGCTPEKPCGHCKSWRRIWDEIDVFIEDNA